MTRIIFNKAAFDTYYQGLAEAERQRVRDGFLEATGLSYPSWYTKRSRGVFSPLEIEKLREITGRDFGIKR